MAFTFKGGLHPQENKITAKCPIEKMPEPDRVAIAMSQHIGVPAIPTVQKGDRVYKGQCIGKNDAGLSCPVHASVSGTVVSVEDRINPMGQKTQYVIIENDYTGELSPDIKRPFDLPLSDVSVEEFVECVKNAGISGMGGATFPTHFKIAGAVGKAEKLIINCCECEPYITANHRLMLEKAEEIVAGAVILMKFLNIKACDIAIEDNKKDAIKKMTKVASEFPEIRVCTMKTKYPQGDERQIIYAIDKIEIPGGRLPIEFGRIVINTETIAAIYRAVTVGMPLIERVVTVTGNIANPKNLLVPLGTSIKDIEAYCGGTVGEIGKIITGGPMMGQAVWDEDTAVTKGTSSLIFLPKDKKKPQNEACIHCGKCIGTCPMHLMPCYLAAFAKIDDIDSLKEFDVMSCVECGCCTYQCPGNVPIVQYIRAAKGKVKKSM